MNVRAQVTSSPGIIDVCNKPVGVLIDCLNAAVTLFALQPVNDVALLIPYTQGEFDMVNCYSRRRWKRPRGFHQTYLQSPRIFHIAIRPVRA